MAKNTKSNKKEIKPFAAIGMFLMSLASIAGFFEIGDTGNTIKNLSLAKSTILPTQTVFNTDPAFNNETNQIYREKEESPPEYASYKDISSIAPRASKY